MRYILILFALTLTACSKDDKTINGTYNIIGSDDAGHSGSGTLQMNNGVMTITVMPTVCNFQNIQYVESNGTITVVRKGVYHQGNGVVNDGDINLNLYVFHSSGATKYVFNGSK